MAKLYGIKGFQASSIGVIGSTVEAASQTPIARKETPNIRIPIAIAQIQLRFMEQICLKTEMRVKFIVA